MIQQTDDVAREGRYRIVLRPTGLAEAAHVHRRHLAIGRQHRRHRNPIVGEVRQPVDDDDGRIARFTEKAIGSFDVAGGEFCSWRKFLDQ